MQFVLFCKNIIKMYLRRGRKVQRSTRRLLPYIFYNSAAQAETMCEWKLFFAHNLKFRQSIGLIKTRVVARVVDGLLSRGLAHWVNWHVGKLSYLANWGVLIINQINILLGKKWHEHMILRLNELAWMWTLISAMPSTSHSLNLRKYDF